MNPFRHLLPIGIVLLAIGFQEIHPLSQQGRIIVVLAIRREGGTFERQPQASSIIHRNDTLVVIGTTGQIEALMRILS